MVEASERLSRLQKDRARVLPRDASATFNPRTQQREPELVELRRGISGRQMKVRSILKRQTQAKWTLAQRKTITALIGNDRSKWTTLTDALSAHLGDVQELPDRQRQEIQRVDRAIARFEELNTREHRIYANVQIPPGMREEEICETPAVHLDRWTAGAHNLHEISVAEAEIDEDTYVLEIPTRRGMYLGQSDGGTETPHLLPRGMTFEVEGIYDATYVTPEGTRGTRRIIRLREVEQEG